MRLAEPPGVRRLARGIDVVLETAKPEDVDAAAERRQLRVGGDGGLEAAERLLALADFKQRFAAPGERRRVVPGWP